MHTLPEKKIKTQFLGRFLLKKGGMTKTSTQSQIKTYQYSIQFQCEFTTVYGRIKNGIFDWLMTHYTSVPHKGIGISTYIGVFDNYL